MVSAIVLAGGSSRRMGPGVDKLMQAAAGKPLLVHALLAFQNCTEVSEIILVAREDRKVGYQKLAMEHGVSKLTKVVDGGHERQDSVWSGLQSLNAKTEIVLIHDGARCLITPEIISRCVDGARKKEAVIPASRVKDTIKRAQNHSNAAHPEIETTVERASLWAAQTPQTFRVDLIRRAYEPLIKEKKIVTDDAAAVELLGKKVFIVECDSTNLKVTTPEDLWMAEIILSKRRC
jgi:2-C-methyl-D-erythritol 4-phosphate cytidylyltransferase